MASAANERNPFDHLRPVSDPNFLYGREHQLRWFTQAMDLVRARQPRHALVFGPTGYGKTSLLNVFDLLAARRGLLPIRMRLNGSLVASDEGFFEGLMAAAMAA